MSLQSLLHYVELRTKVASMIPFLFGVLYGYWAYGGFDLINTALMLVSLLCIDMATTASNHYMDFQRDTHRSGYNFETHNTLARDGITLKTALKVILTLVVLGIITGLILFLRTDLWVLILGVVSFIAGLLYSWGPVPISRGPFGEVVSGVFMGFVIVLLSAYIQLQSPDWIALSLAGTRMTLDIDTLPFLRLLTAASPLVFGIANIMLSNNLCDLEEDRINGRVTLAVLIGGQRALILSGGLYIGMFTGVVAAVLSMAVPLSCGLACLSIPYVWKSYAQFSMDPSKETTFILAVKSFLAMGALYCLGLGVGILL